jgi:orotidine-5'-phosphate decarboxylase
VTARDEAGSDLRLLAVTVLTSLRGDEYPTVYRDADPAKRVVAFARAAVEAGVDGVVCSPRELAVLRDEVPAGFLRVTPGIRPAGAAVGDQARVATPESAVADGASHLVIGRAVTAAPDPATALEAILDGLAGASV